MPDKLLRLIQAYDVKVDCIKTQHEETAAFGVDSYVSVVPKFV